MTPEEVVNTMMEKDYFSQWLGIKVLDTKKGYCKLSATVKKDMLNGFGIAHGGITYSVADSALAFASNSGGRKSVSIETSISHIASLKESDVILAEACCESETEKLGHYTIKIVRESDKKTVALFKGIVYRTSSSWE